MTSDGDLPIHWAATRGHTEVRVHIRIGNTWSEEVLFFSLSLSHTHTHACTRFLMLIAQMIQLLLSHGSPVDPANTHGWTPLHRAANNNKQRAAKFLVDKGASLLARTTDGHTPLHLACHLNNLAMIELLLDLGARYDEVDHAKKTPYDLCITDAARDIFETFPGFKSAMGME
jgi:ankyrin repeat protein